MKGWLSWRMLSPGRGGEKGKGRGGDRRGGEGRGEEEKREKEGEGRG